MRKRAIALMVVLIVLMSSMQVQACTLWAAAGDRAAGRGVIIAKNRDWRPDHRQELRFITPAGGYRYYGIYALGMGMKAGINEQGLVVVSAAASTIPSSERDAMEHTKHLLARLLAECDSVDAVLAKRYLFVGPQYLLVADSTKVAQVEIAPRGESAVKVVENGVLFHTNHYLEDSLLWANGRIGVSSSTRLERIGRLIDEKQILSLDDFIMFSGDMTAGPDNSLWRTGRTPTTTRTLAAWIVALTPGNSPKIYVRLANPGEEEKVYHLDAAELFKINR